LIASDNHPGRSLASADTDYSADCIEFCPFQGFENIFVCGTYQVIEPAASTNKQTRRSKDRHLAQRRGPEDSWCIELAMTRLRCMSMRYRISVD